LVYIG
jgi:transposase